MRIRSIDILLGFAGSVFIYLWDFDRVGLCSITLVRLSENLKYYSVCINIPVTSQSHCSLPPCHLPSREVGPNHDDPTSRLIVWPGRWDCGRLLVCRIVGETTRSFIRSIRFRRRRRAGAIEQQGGRQ
jgi:hypothetical protein